MNIAGHQTEVLDQQHVGQRIDKRIIFRGRYLAIKANEISQIMSTGQHAEIKGGPQQPDCFFETSKERSLLASSLIDHK